MAARTVEEFLAGLTPQELEWCEAHMEELRRGDGSCLLRSGRWPSGLEMKMYEWLVIDGFRAKKKIVMDAPGKMKK
jgi:hypothetical protein